jgi:hypothetical protein
MLKDIGAEDKEEAPRDIEIEEIDAILENPKLDSENKEDTNMYEIDDMLKERGIDIDEQKESVEPKKTLKKLNKLVIFYKKQINQM